MPASLPGATLVENQANPSQGRAVTFSPFSGPKGSPFDAKVYPSNIVHPVPSQRVADPGNCSTGALSTGIGFALDSYQPGIALGGLFTPTAKPPILGPTDDYAPGLSTPVPAAAVDARYLAIGGGKNVMTAGPGTDWSRATSDPVPYVAQPILAAGNGASRDAGAGPAYTGFGMKMVTAPASVPNGTALEAGFTNRTGGVVVVQSSVYGSQDAASPAVT